MAEKKLTLILHGADRKLWQGGRTKMRVTGLSSDGLETLWLRRESGTRPRKNLPLDGSITEVNLDLRFDAGQVYAVLVTAAGHRPTWRLINRGTFLRQEGSERSERTDVIIRLMLVPRKPRSTDLNEGFVKLLNRGSPFAQSGRGITKKEYLDLVPESKKMAFLNIESKLRSTTLGGTPLISYVTGIRHIMADRVYLMMQAEVKEKIEVSPDFAAAPGHGKPTELPELPGHPDSWKHRIFESGNLQLSFAASSESWPKSDDTTARSFSVDVDIDLERGIKHWAEWLDNNVFHPGQKTDQTLVYALLYSQGILPDYTLNPLPQENST